MNCFPHNSSDLISKAIPPPLLQLKIGWKKQSLNHLVRDLSRTHEDILNPQINEENLFCRRDWNQEDLWAIFLEVPGLLHAEQPIPTQQMALTL